MTFNSKARRAGWLLVIAAFAFGIVSAIRPAPTQAYGLISTRSIEMSSSDASGASGSGLGTNVIYKVGFSLATAGQTVGAVVIHFCSNDPIIGDACTVPTGFNTNFSTLSVNNWAVTNSSTTVSAMTIDATNSNQNTVILTRTPGAVNGNATFSFELGNGSSNGFTNPSTTNSTFFARITVYSTNTPTWAAPSGSPLTDAAGGTDATTEKTATDAGGVAMSTANVLNVTAKVQEQLTFCVHTGNLCADGGNSVLLGDSNNVLAATNQVYTDQTPKFDVASNALGGVIVRLKGDTLTSGSFTITPDGPNCTADSTATTDEQFGVRIVSYGTGMYNGDATTAGAGGGTPSGGVNDFGCTAGNHKFDPTTTNTTYGQNFVRTLGATDLSTTNFEIAAKASSTTEAGVYTTKLMLIATATY